jgi:ribosomal protein L30E
MKRQLKEAADMAKAKLTSLDVTSEELSAQLKKPFTITVLAISK